VFYIRNPAKADRLLRGAGVLLLAWDKPIVVRLVEEIGFALYQRKKGDL